MSHNEQRSEDVRERLAKARQDLRAAKVGLSVDPPLTSDVVFHAQQLAKKTLKAFLTWHDTPFRRTHDLAKLGALCSAIDSSIDDICRQAASLSVYAWVFRYPGDLDEPSLQETTTAIEVAQSLHVRILEILPSATHP